MSAEEIGRDRRKVRDLPLVVSSGLCVGCGACATVAPDHLSMELTSRGTYEPVARDGRSLAEQDELVLERGSAVCPFSDGARDEDSIASGRFAGPDVAKHEVAGHHRKIVAGHVAAGDFRERGTSGGMTSWMLFELLSRGHVDGVIHVASTHGELPGPLSRYTISRSIDELLSGRKSRYHVQTLAEVMSDVRQTPGRYAIVGVPCFVKAVRLLTDSDDVLRERLTFTVALGLWPLQVHVVLRVPRLVIGHPSHRGRRHRLSAQGAGTSAQSLQRAHLAQSR